METERKFIPMRDYTHIDLATFKPKDHLDYIVLGREFEELRNRGLASINQAIEPKKKNKGGKPKGATKLSVVILDGQAIIEEREKLKLSQNRLAERSGMGRTTLSDATRGIHNASFETANKIARALGVSPYKIIK